MKLFMKKILYKILVTSLITITLTFFSKTSVSEAKLTMTEGEFYYSGTQEAEAAPFDDSIWTRITKALSEIFDYLIGIMTLGIRGVIVGCIEVMELILTTLLNPNSNIAEVFSGAVIASASGDYSESVVTIESIIFNEVDILNANLFK